jgi:hypothetical protein
MSWGERLASGDTGWGLRAAMHCPVSYDHVFTPFHRRGRLAILGGLNVGCGGLSCRGGQCREIDGGTAVDRIAWCGGNRPECSPKQEEPTLDGRQDGDCPDLGLTKMRLSPLPLAPLSTQKAGQFPGRTQHDTTLD